jgi:uncharacterized delta-60 repeat protein
MLMKKHARRFVDRSNPARIENLEQRQLFAANALDTAFGGSGGALSTFGTDATFTSVVTLPDGKVLAAGTVNNGARKHDFLVARYNANGTLDTSFGGGTGRVFTDFSGRDDFAAQLVQVGGGKFVVVGRSSIGDVQTQPGFASTDFAIARYNANGTLDASFSNGAGRRTINFFGKYDAATSAAVLSDGRLLVVGTVDGNPDTFSFRDFGIVRLNTNGSLDTSFDGDGKLSSNFGVFTDNSPFGSGVYGDQQANAVSVLPGDGFLVAGSIDDRFDSGETFRDFAIAKYTNTGKLDTSFGGGDGWAQFNVGGQINRANAMAVLSSGKILLAGAAQPTGSDGDSDFALARINIYGTIDTTFGSNGTGAIITDLNQDPSDPDASSAEEIRGISVQPNGKILATGTYTFRNNEATLNFLPMVRYTANGALDTSFSGDGKQLYGQLGGGNAIAASVNGKTVVVGFLDNKAGVVRFQSDFATTASIAGSFFIDLDGDGVKDGNEGVLKGWQAFVDSNNDGFYTPGEAVATSDANGKYTIKGLLPGTYRIREVRLNGWNRTKPGGAYPLGYYDVTVAVGQIVVGKDFGNKKA